MSPTPRAARFLGLMLGALLLAGPAAAKTTGVGEDSAVQSGPCYEALVDKNETSPTTAPKRELGAACQAEDGDIDKAWARVQRLWGSDSVDLPDYGSYRPADAPPDGVTPRWLSALGVVLTYLALGAPLRAVGRGLGVYPGDSRGAAAGSVVALALRAAVGAVFLALLRVPYAGAAIAAGLVAATLSKLARPAAAPIAPATGTFAANVAEVINDVIGACLPLAALALFVQQNWLYLAAALALALPASTAPAIVARRALRVRPLVRAALAAGLVAALGEMLVSSAPVSTWIGGLSGASLIAPAILAGLTLVAGLALTRAPQVERT